MSQISPLIPRQPVPALSVETVAGETWTLAAQKPENFTLIVVYRGLHCPICSTYLRDLDRKLEEFGARGVEVIALSSDDAGRAAQTWQDWKLENLTLGYGLTLDKAREWGLYISAGIGTTSIGIEEPERFVEPGLFLIRPNGELYFASIQTMPFARPDFGAILKALDFVLAKNYPGRGEIVDDLAAAAE